MDGTGELFAPLIDALPPGTDVRVVSYPVDDVLEYADLLPIAQAAIPTSGSYILVGESFSGPLAITLASGGDPRLTGIVICCSYARAPLPRALRLLRYLAWPGLVRFASRSRIFNRSIPVPQVTGPLVGQIPDIDCEGERIGGADGETGAAVVAFLPEAVSHGVQAELAHCIALGAVVAVLDDTANTQ